MHLRRAAVALVLVLALRPQAVTAQAKGSFADRESFVRRFIDAFNAQDADRMSQFVTDDVQWLSIDGKSVSAETETKQELLRSMRAYFKSCPTCRSSLSGVVATASRLSAVEVATWIAATGPREQRGISVYEFSGSLISRVYYFPVEK